MNTWSRCSVAQRVHGERADERVATACASPPVSITVRSARGSAASTSATRIELVTTVRSATVDEAPPSCHVVVPAVIPIAVPGAHEPAAARAIARFSSMLLGDLAVEPRLVGAVARTGSVAPPWTLATSPASCEHVEVAADGHVADAELVGELG